MGSWNGPKVEVVFEQFQERLRGYCVAITWGNKELAKDLVQDAFATFMEQIQRGAVSYAGNGQLFSLLRKFALGHWLNFRKKRRPDALGGDGDDYPGTDHLDLASILDLRQCLGGLDSSRRSVIDKLFNEQEDFAAIANEQGIPEGTARSRYYSALRALRDCLQGKLDA